MKDDKTYTIQETAKLSGLPESTIRYYESIGIIPPIERGSSSKHRIYGEKDLDIVISAACLSATGMSIDNMRSYMANAVLGKQAVAEQIKMLDTQYKHLSNEIKYIKLQQKYVKVKVDYWNAVKKGNKKDIELIKNKAQDLANKMKEYKKR